SEYKSKPNFSTYTLYGIVSIYGIPDDSIRFPEPILIPFYATKNPKPSRKRPFIAFDKSFVFGSSEQLKDIHTSNQELINSICREMVNISDAGKSILETRFEFIGTPQQPNISESAYKNHLLFRLWKTVLPLLSDECVLAYESTYKNSRITRPQNHLSFKIKLT